MLTQERLKELLHYDPETGVFTWRVANGNRIRAGDIADTITAKGYSRFQVDGRKYMAHRLAYIYMTGEWPIHQIDHRDLNRANNRWLNIRPATQSQNQANRPARNELGLKGAYKRTRGNGYMSVITVAGERHYLGNYSTPEDAHAAYVEAANENFGEFARAS